MEVKNDHDRPRKVVELNVYNGLPHLLIPVVTDPKKAAGSLNWAVNTMMDRYNKFAEIGAKDLKSYNARVENLPYESEQHKKMPQIIIIIDELADLMMVAQSEVEDAICRLAQLARCSRYSSDYCHTASICQCYYRPDQSQRTVTYRFLRILRCRFTHYS